MHRENNVSLCNFKERIISGASVGVADVPDWLAGSYETFRCHVTDDAYPCFFGTQAERRGEMFYAYVSKRDIAHVPAAMATFLQLSSKREHEKNNFAVFFEPSTTPL